MDPAFPCFINDNRDQIGLREIAIIVRGFLRALGFRGAAVGVPAAGFLDDGSAFTQHFGLAFDFELDGLLDTAERRDVLDLGLDAEFSRAFRPQADVRLGAQRAFLHIAVAHAEILEDALELDEVGVRFLPGVNVRFGHDFEERHARAVEINAARAAGERVCIARGVLLHMRAANAHALDAAGDIKIEIAVVAQGQIVLADLIVLRLVGIEIVLAVHLRPARDFAVECEPDGDRRLDHRLVQRRQDTGHAEADRADVRVRRCMEIVLAAAKHFGSRTDLDVDFQSDDGFEFHG